MALSEQSRSAFMRAAAILAQGKAPAVREVIFRNAQSYADRGSWIPTITAEEFPVLFFPGDTQRQATFAEAIRNAQEVGELSRPGPSEPQGLWPLQFAAWPGLPPVPTDSPLIYWLPEWLPSDAARLEATTAASPTEPTPAAVAGLPPATPPATPPAQADTQPAPEEKAKKVTPFNSVLLYLQTVYKSGKFKTTKDYIRELKKLSNHSETDSPFMKSSPGDISFFLKDGGKSISISIIEDRMKLIR